MQWFEGVALVQALCRQLSARTGADGMFPGPSQISLASDGSVTIGEAAATRAVTAAGHLLARMLSDDVSVRLRLLVTQATAEDATSGSLHEFSEALAYFERPNPEGILSALHARAAVAPPARRQDAAIAAPVAEPAPRASSSGPRARKRRRAVVVAAVAILLLAVTGLFVRAGLRNGRLASVVERLESAIADAGRSHDRHAQRRGDAGTRRGRDHGRWRDDSGATPIRRPYEVSQRHHASARVRARATDCDGAAGARGSSAGERLRPQRGDVCGEQQQGVLEVRCVGHAAAAGLRGPARSASTGKAGQRLSPSSISWSPPTGRWSTRGCARRRATSMNSCWSALPRRGGSIPRRSTAGRSASGSAWRLRRLNEVANRRRESRSGP